MIFLNISYRCYVPQSSSKTSDSVRCSKLSNSLIQRYSFYNSYEAFSVSIAFEVVITGEGKINSKHFTSFLNFSEVGW